MVVTSVLAAPDPFDRYNLSCSPHISYVERTLHDWLCVGGGSPQNRKEGLPVMGDVENIALPDDEAPDTDAMEQRLVIDPDDDTGLDLSHVDAVSDRDANSADVIDQAIVVPVPEDDYDPR